MEANNFLKLFTFCLTFVLFTSGVAQVENVQIESVTNQTFIITQPNINDSLGYYTYLQLVNTRISTLDSTKVYNVVITFQNLMTYNSVAEIFPETFTCSGSLYFKDSLATKSFVRFFLETGNSLTLENQEQVDSTIGFFAMSTTMNSVSIQQLWTDSRILCVDVGPIEQLQTYPQGWIIITEDLYDLSQQFDPNGLAKSTNWRSEGSNKIANIYYLFDNYPNPFNPSTKIEFTIPENQFVTIKVYDILGEEVRTLVNEAKEAGYYSIDFDASNLATGIYIYKMQAGDFMQTKKMILMR